MVSLSIEAVHYLGEIYDNFVRSGGWVGFYSSVFKI